MLLVELNFAVGERKQGKVVSATDVASGMILRSSLAKNDVPGQNLLSSKFLYSESLAIAVSSVFGSALSFLVSHDWILCWGLLAFDRLDFYHGNLLAMALATFVALSALFLEDNDLLGLLVLKNLSFD